MDDGERPGPSPLRFCVSPSRLSPLHRERQLYRRERLAMDRRDSHAQDRLSVLWGAVTLMLAEAVARILLVEAAHHPVTRDFGHHRTRRDRHAGGIALDNRPL